MLKSFAISWDLNFPKSDGCCFLGILYYFTYWMGTLITWACFWMFSFFSYLFSKLLRVDWRSLWIFSIWLADVISSFLKSSLLFFLCQAECWVLYPPVRIITSLCLFWNLENAVTFNSFRVTTYGFWFFFSIWIKWLKS